jgi:hypothetical protein
MELSKRPYPTTLIVIAALHLGLLLVVAKPKLPAHGSVSYMELLPPVQFKPKARPLASTAAAQPSRPVVVSRRQPPKPADVGVAAPALEPAQPDAPAESAAPDFAAAPKPLDIDQLRKQAAKNDSDFKTPLDKVREGERRHKSIETTVAAAAKAGARKDCQNGYAGLGILAIIPILYGTVTDNGCKWK